MRAPRWFFSPEETRDLGVSMNSELDSAALLTGNTPTVSAWTKSGSTYTQVSDFVFANQQPNASEVTSDDGETIAIGKGILFRCTSPTTQGTYYIRSECDADDGTHVVREDVMVVRGAATPA